MTGAPEKQNMNSTKITVLAPILTNKKPRLSGAFL
jgi:hypothetical protein